MPGVFSVARLHGIISAVQTPPPTPPPRLRRRDFLKFGALAVGAYGLGKAGLAMLGGDAPARPATLAHLSPKQAAIVTAAAAVIVGAAGRAALAQSLWNPAADVDGMLERMAPDQRAMLGVGLHLVENATWGLRGFTSFSFERQAAHLDAWRTSGVALKRGIWGFLHAATATSFASTAAGWKAMGYPGPCLASSGAPGRPPGQSAAYTWDEKVP